MGSIGTGDQIHEVEVGESISRMTVIKLLLFMTFAVTGEKNFFMLQM